MSFDGAVGPAISTIGNMMAVGLVAKVAQGTMKSVGNSYHSNEKSHRTQIPHKNHMFSMQGHKSASKRKGYSLWEGTGF